MSTFSGNKTIPVPIANSELHELTSSLVEQKYFIKIRLPEKYYETTESYPVLYLLDGDHAFAMATDIVQYLIYGSAIPDLIIVSPAYGSKDTPDYGGVNRRNRDFFPFSLKGNDETPGAIKYLQFFQQELIPNVEALYRINSSDRTLLGYSYGGIFAFYVLFQCTELFRRYIVIDGIYDPIFEIEESYAQHHKSLPIKLCIAGPHGARGRSITKFVDQVRGRNYTGLDMKLIYLSSIKHFMLGAEGFTKGLVSIFHK